MRWRTLRVRLAFWSFVVAAGLLLVIVADRLTGWAVPARPGPFPPDTEARYKTSEFEFTSKTNSLGFRGPEATRERGKAVRILAIGDSFTYGWGVESGDSWPMLLERSLKARGADVEVLNLGIPGGTPLTYAATAERAIPVLRPDLVLVAVLQGEDLSQLDQEKPRRQAGLFRRGVQLAIPNFLRLRSEVFSRKSHSQQDFAELWRTQAQQVIAEISSEERQRLDRLEPGVRNAFRNGDLSPHIVGLGLRQPGYFGKTLELADPLALKLIDSMAVQLGRIQSAGAKSGATVIVASVPYKVYVSPSAHQAGENLGFLLTREMLTSGAPDEAIRSACSRAGLRFYAVTTEFRAAAPFRALFFPLDGHFNAAGHSLYAQCLTPLMQAEVSRVPARN